MMKFLFKLAVLLGVAGVAGILAPEYLPAEWRRQLDNGSFRLFVFFFVLMSIIDVGCSLYIHFSDITSRKFIRQISASFITLSAVFVAYPVISLSFQEARIKANFEKALTEKNLNTSEMKAHIDASIKMSENNAVKNAFPYFLTLTIALLIFCVMYHYLDSTKDQAKEDAGKRTTKRSSRR